MKKVLKRVLMCVLVLAMSITCVSMTAETTNAAKLSASKKTILATKTFKLTVKNLKKNYKVQYSSYNSSIAKVSSKGVVKGVAPGETTIYAKVVNKKNSYDYNTLYCSVKVVAPTFSDINLAQDGDIILGQKHNGATLTFKSDMATDVKVSVCDALDKAVFTKTVKTAKNAANKIAWNGKDDKGKNVDAGSYYFKISSCSTVEKSAYFTVYTTSDFSGGVGSAGNPYVITSADQLSKLPYHDGCSFVLNNDIDMQLGSVGNFFTADAGFSGTFDGQGHKISNMMTQTALFGGIAETGTVKNLVLSNILLSGTGNDVAVLAKNNEGVIENCSVIDSSITGNGDSAMLVITNYGTLKSCTVSGEISASGHSAGLAYENEAIGKIIDCSSAVNLNPNAKSVGGIVRNNYGLMSGCVCTGDIDVSNGRYDYYAGGVCRYNKGVIQRCFYAGNTTEYTNYYTKELYAVYEDEGVVQ